MQQIAIGFDHRIGLGFDLDGTLVHSLDFTAQWMTKAATKALGHPVSEAEVRSHFGKPEPDIFREMLKDGPAAEAFGFYQEILREECFQMKVYPQVFETLDHLVEKGIPLALFTSRGTWATGEILARLDLAKYFPMVLTGEHVKEVKPHPEGILRMCEELKVKPENFFYIGDSPADVMAAENAGARGYQALWAKSAGLYGANHLHSVDEVKALVRLLTS
jgi:pyrophosphatase PpaX